MQPPRLSQIHHAQGCPAPYAQHGIAMHRAVQPNFDQTQGCPAQVLSDTRLSSLKVTASSPKVWYGGQHKHPTHRQASFVPFCRIVTRKVLYLCFKPSLPISFSMPSKIYSSEALQPSRLAGPVTSHCHTQLWQGMTSSVNSPAWLGIPGRQRGMLPCNIMGLSSPADIEAKQKKGAIQPKAEKGAIQPMIGYRQHLHEQKEKDATTFGRSKHNPKIPLLGVTCGSATSMGCLKHMGVPPAFALLPGTPCTAGVPSGQPSLPHILWSPAGSCPSQFQL